MKTYIMACVLVVAAASYNSAMATCDQTFNQCIEEQEKKNSCYTGTPAQQKACQAENAKKCSKYKTCLQ